MHAKRWSFNYLWMLLVAIGSSTAASGQTDMATALYGRGVHAYFADRTDEATKHFNSSISLGTRDPRVYFFRGLAFLRQGRQYEAEADFDRAAQLEYRGITSVNVGRALERVQGYQRFQLEKVRRQTHATLAQQRAYQSPKTPLVPQQPEGDPRMLRTPVPGGTDTIEPVQDAPASETDPFEDDGGFAADAEPAEPALPDAEPMDAVPPGDDEVNPFEDDGPFGEPAPAPAEESPLGSPDYESLFGPADEESPFGPADEEPAIEDVPAESPADAAPPAGGGEPAEVEGPFGDDEDLFGEG